MAQFILIQAAKEVQQEHQNPLTAKCFGDQSSEEGVLPETSLKEQRRSV